ncbi:cell cycle checkpoint control protein RAD9A-like [Ostrea edulis]|uniref:cell cycle checkpoint control protein RAD9A-like n=1 Tax=Ostrea edulis TaxID=37623 RepID=UPI00209441D2|nr:cell cycle checkpoint control protein RAD9A-like [Ostrea edulis]
MKCVIPGVNIKVFGRAIHSLAKIGEELYIEPLPHGLALRTVNSSRSAYACFLFSPTFFQNYDDGSPETSSQDSEDVIRCKIAMRSCLTVFKSMSNVEKTVEKCQITLNMQKARLIFKLYCKHGIVKTHNLAFIECETLQAVFSKDMCPNQLTAQPRLLCDTVVNFQSNQEEITLIVSPEKISLKNYVDDEPDPTKVVHTVLNLDPDEFDNCQIGVDTDITFCLKEFRAVLAFAEITAMPLNIKFESSGRPVVFSIDADSAFEANFVLATLAESHSQNGNPVDHTTQQTFYSRAASSSVRSHTRKGKSQRGHHHVNQSNNSYGSHPNRHRPLDRNNHSANLDLMEEDFEDEVQVPSISKAGRLQATENGVPDRVYQAESVFARHSNQSSPQPSTSSSYQSPVIPNPLQQSVLEDINMDGEEDEPVPGTPPKKKFRSMFFGISQASSAASQGTWAPPSRQVLVEDTDEEED